MTRVNSGADIQSHAMGGDTTMTDTGTASSAPTATTLTDSTKSWTTNQWQGHLVLSGAVIGVVLSNTGTVLTVDMWHQSSSANYGSTTAGTTPSNGATYVIAPGNAPACFLGLSVATRTIAGADTYLTNDGSTVSELWASGGGLNRAIAAFTHTAGASSYTLTKTFTSNSSDNGGSAATVHRIGVFQANVTAAPTTSTGILMLFETNLTNDAVLVPTAGDQLTITESVSI